MSDDLRQWLSKLGLEQHAEILAANDIDLDVLPELSAEDLRDLLSRYHEAMTAVVERYGGYVANYLGDGVLAYFGWPRADEDDAAQAVRAGLTAVAAAKELSLQ